MIEVYCDCKVDEIGTDKITGNQKYLVWLAYNDLDSAWNKKHKYDTCKFCEGRLKHIDCKCSYCKPMGRITAVYLRQT